MIPVKYLLISRINSTKYRDKYYTIPLNEVLHMVEFGERLRTLRKQRNLTQKQLAELVGVQNSIISFYEVGDRMPSPEMLVKLAAALRVSADYLLGIQKTDTIDVSGLTADEIAALRNLAELLRSKHSAE